MTAPLAPLVAPEGLTAALSGAAERSRLDAAEPVPSTAFVTRDAGCRSMAVPSATTPST